jgi:hypothetical protein
MEDEPFEIVKKIEAIVEKLRENLYEEKEERKEEILREVEEDIKKQIKYEDTEKVLPGDIKVIERKIFKFPVLHIDYIDYNILIAKLVEEKIGERLKEKIKNYMKGKEGWEDYYKRSLKENISRVKDEFTCLAFRYITDDRFPSYYTAVHIYNGYLNCELNKEVKEHKVRTAFDEVLNDKIRFPIWVSFADNFFGASKGERLFVFGKKNPAFKKALEETAKEFETKYLSFKQLCNYMIKHPTEGLSYSWGKFILDGHQLSTGHLDLLGEIEKTNEVVLVGFLNNVDKCKKWKEFIVEKELQPIAIPTMMHYNVPLFTCPSNGVQINILGDIKFKDAEMYVDMKGYTRDKYKILSEGPKVIFFYDPHEDGKEKK